MIAIDLSNSMLLEDIKPNRLERAKASNIKKLIDQLEGDRNWAYCFCWRSIYSTSINN